MGPEGPAGTPGVSGLEMISNFNIMTSNATQALTVSCTNGKRALGGGASINNGNGQVVMTFSRPALTPIGGVQTPTGWTAGGQEIADYTSNWGLTVYVICANVS